MKKKLNKVIIGYERHAVTCSGGKCKCAVCNRVLPFTRAQIETKAFGEFITVNGCLWCDVKYYLAKIKLIKSLTKINRRRR